MTIYRFSETNVLPAVTTGEADQHRLHSDRAMRGGRHDRQRAISRAPFAPLRHRLSHAGQRRRRRGCHPGDQPALASHD